LGGRKRTGFAEEKGGCVLPPNDAKGQIRVSRGKGFPSERVGGWGGRGWDQIQDGVKKHTLGPRRGGKKREGGDVEGRGSGGRGVVAEGLKTRDALVHQKHQE